MADVTDRLIDEIERSYAELTDQLSDPEVLAAMADYRLVEREQGADYGAELWLRKELAPLRP